jgi:hypothetical protein
MPGMRLELADENGTRLKVESLPYAACLKLVPQLS